MLYPIELLRHNANALNGASGTASILTASLCFVMSSLSFSAVVRRVFDCRETRIMQIAMAQNDIIANCNPRRVKHLHNLLVLKDIY